MISGGIHRPDDELPGCAGTGLTELLNQKKAVPKPPPRCSTCVVNKKRVFWDGVQPKSSLVSGVAFQRLTPHLGVRDALGIFFL